MKGFILKVNSYEISKVLSCSVSLMLTLTWGIDILLRKLTSESKGMNLENALCTLSLGRGDFMQSVSSFLISLVVIRKLMP